MLPVVLEDQEQRHQPVRAELAHHLQRVADPVDGQRADNLPTVSYNFRIRDSPNNVVLVVLRGQAQVSVSIKPSEERSLFDTVSSMADTEKNLVPEFGIIGLEVGADDYVVKATFSVREFLLRVRAVLRRSGPGAGDDTPDPSGEPFLTFGPLKIDLDGHRVYVLGEEIVLTATEFKLLHTLASRHGRVQTRGTLLQDVWDMPPDINTRTVDTHVKRLREKLGDQVLAVNKNFSQNLNQYKIALQAPGEKIKLIIRRDGQIKAIEFKVKNIM